MYICDILTCICTCLQVCVQVCVCVCAYVRDWRLLSLCLLWFLCLCDRLTWAQMVADEHMNFTSHFTCWHDNSVKAYMIKKFQQILLKHTPLNHVEHFDHCSSRRNRSWHRKQSVTSIHAGRRILPVFSIGNQGLIIEVMNETKLQFCKIAAKISKGRKNIHNKQIIFIFHHNGGEKKGTKV